MNRYSIKQCCDVNKSSTKLGDCANGLLYLDTSNITDNIIASLQKYDSITDAPSRAQRKVSNNTILFSEVRPALKHIGILDNPQDNLIVSTGFCTIDVKDEYKEFVNPYYLYYLISQDYVINRLQQIAENSASSYPSIRPSDIENLTFDFPDKSIQESIADVLLNFDKKIALNRRENATLEAMAKQLYDYWFVQFDFPDANGRPYKISGGKMVWNETLKREIPEGWEVTPLEELLSLYDHKRVPVSSKDRVKGPYPYYGATGIMDYVNDYIFDGDYLLLAEDGSTNDGTDHPIIQYIWGKTWVNNHAHIIRPRDNSHIHFTYYQLKGIPLKRIESGSIQKKVSQENLLSYKIVNPAEQVITKYCNYVKPVWEKYKSLADETGMLVSMRDFIIPLLMSGQVKIDA